MRTLLTFGLAALALSLASAAGAAERTVTLKVAGMECAACPYVVSSTLKRVAGVKSVKTSLAKRTAVVVYDDARTNVAALTGATASAGYPSSPVQ